MIRHLITFPWYITVGNTGKGNDFLLGWNQFDRKPWQSIYKKNKWNFAWSNAELVAPKEQRVTPCHEDDIGHPLCFRSSLTSFNGFVSLKTPYYLPSWRSALGPSNKGTLKIFKIYLVICFSRCHARVAKLPSRTRHTRLCRIYYFLQNNWRKAHSTSLVLIQISSIQKNEAFTFHWPVCRARGHVVFFSWCHSLPSRKPMKSQEPNEREIVVSWWKLTRQASKMLRGAILGERRSRLPLKLSQLPANQTSTNSNTFGQSEILC